MSEVLTRSEPSLGQAEPASERRSYWPDIAGIAVVVGICLYYWARVVNLFPETEFVEWISWPAWDMISDSLKAIVTFRNDGGFSRHIAIDYATFLGRVCGTNVACINTMAFLPLFSGALALFGLARLCGLRALGATTVVVVTLVSTPVFDALTWQATLLDRMSLFALPGLLILTIVCVRRARMRPLFVASWAIVLTVLGMIGCNIKEPVWVIVPLMVLAPLALTHSRRQAVAAAATLALPVVVMTVHIVKILHDLNGDPTKVHFSGGSISVNLPLLTRFALPGGLALMIVLALLALAMVIPALFARQRAPEAYDAARIALWLGVGVLASWVLPLRTQYPSRFYMIVPLGLAALAFGVALRAFALALHGRVAFARQAAICAAVLVAVWCVGVSAFDRWEPTRDWLFLDHNFRASLPEIAAARQQFPQDVVQFHAPPEQYGAYRFVAVGRAEHLWRFISPQAGDRGYPVAAVPETCGNAKDHTVLFLMDDSMHFTGTCPQR